MLNRNLLVSIAEQIEEEPEHFDMRQWGMEVVDEDAPICGTAYCVAGWALALNGYEPLFRDVIEPLNVQSGRAIRARTLMGWRHPETGHRITSSDTPHTADRLLGWSPDQRPYFPGEWDSDDNPSLYHQFDLTKEQMAEVLRHLADAPEGTRAIPTDEWLGIHVEGADEEPDEDGECSDPDCDYCQG